MVYSIRAAYVESKLLGIKTKVFKNVNVETNTAQTTIHTLYLLGDDIIKNNHTLALVYTASYHLTWT